MAAERGFIDMMKWAIENGCKGYSEIFCEAAAGGGQLETLKWLQANGYEWHHSACTAAADYSHLEILKWLRQNGCPWNEFTASTAAFRGSIEVVQYIIENGCPMDQNECIIQAMLRDRDEIANLFRNINKT